MIEDPYSCSAEAIVNDWILFHYLDVKGGGQMTRDLVQTFLISTIVNAFADRDESRTWPQKVARAALVSVPTTIVVNTDRVVENVAERFPSLGICENTIRPRNIVDMVEKVEEKVNMTRNRVVAFYSRPEDHWKNPPGAPES